MFIKKKKLNICTKNYFFNLDRTPYIPSLLFITTFIPSIPSPYDQTPALQNLHRRLRASTARLSFTVVGWASRSSVYVRRSSPRSSLIRRRPSTPRSRFESHFHLLCQWVLEQRVKSSSNWEVVFWFLFFVFVVHHQSGKPIFPVLCLLLRWSFDLQSKHRRRTL